MSSNPISKIPTWPSFRYLRRSWHESAPWILSPLIDDEEALRRGFVLGGQGRNASQLSISEQLELYSYLSVKYKSLSSHEKERLSYLLGRTSFVKYLSLLDIDVNRESRDYNIEKAAKFAKDCVARLAYYAPECGLGNPDWCTTNDYGGYHADLVASPAIADPDLMGATRLLVLKLAKKANVPLLSEQSGKRKIDRAPVYLDDSVTNKYPDAKGGLWRLQGTSKPYGSPKIPIELSNDHIYAPIDDIALLGALEEYKVSKRVEAEKLNAPKSRIIVDTGKALAPLTEEDKQFFDSHSELNDIWARITEKDRSRRDFDFVLKAKQYGADDEMACRLLRAMPGNKASVDYRNTAYDASILKSVWRTLSRPYTNYIDYTGFLKPRDYSKSDRDLLFKAARLARDTKTRNKLNATGLCGDVSVVEKELLVPVRFPRCERSTCIRCVPRRAYLQIQNAITYWPEKLLFLKHDLTDSGVKAGQQYINKLKKSIRKLGTRSKVKKFLCSMRTFRAPGSVIVICRKGSLIPDGFKLISKAECLEKLKQHLYNRLFRTLKHIQDDDAEGLANDPWNGHVVSVTGGRLADKHLPWLSKKDIRRAAKTNVDHASHEFNIVDKSTGKVIKSRTGATFKDHEVFDALLTMRRVNECILVTSGIKLRIEKPPD